MKGLIIKNINIEGPGRLGEFLLSEGIPLDSIELHNGNKIPEDLNSYRFIIILGGPMNVYEEEKYPFLRDEDRLIKEALKIRIPVIGICLGAQLIAKAAGAKVLKNPVKEIGWYKISLTEKGLADPLFKGLEKEFLVFQWHGDTFSVPKGGVQLAESTLCKNQAFKIGSAYGLQFHIEVTPEMIKNWIDSYKEELNLLKGIIDPERIINETPRYMPEYLKNSGMTLKNLKKAIDLR